MLIGSAFLLFIFAETKRTISKLEGAMMLFSFVIYYALVFVV